MTDWAGGYGDGVRPPNAKIAVKRHRHVSLIKTDDPVLAEELLARPKLSRFFVGRLTDTVLLIRPGQVAEVMDELRRMGHTPKTGGVS